MIKKSVLILFILQVLILHPQSGKEKLALDLQSYGTAINSSDFKTQMKFMPEFIFDSISRKDMLSDMQKMISEEEFNIDLKYFKIDTLITINGKQYSRLQFSYNFTLDFSGFKNTGGMDYAIKMSHKSLIDEYGKENVTFNDWVFHIVSSSKLYGLKEDNLTFTDLNERSSPFIPDEIKSK